MVGRIDDGDPTVLEETLRLARGEAHETTGTILGGGDAIIVTWVTTPEDGTSRFPIETPGCPTDVREAGQVTTHPRSALSSFLLEPSGSRSTRRLAVLDRCENIPGRGQ